MMYSDYYTTRDYLDPHLVEMLPQEQHLKIRTLAINAAPPIYLELLSREEYDDANRRREQSIQRNIVAYTRTACKGLRAAMAKNAASVLLSAIHPDLHSQLGSDHNPFSLWELLKSKAMPTSEDIPGLFEYLMSIKLTTPSTEAAQAFMTEFEKALELFLGSLLSEHDTSELYTEIRDVESGHAAVNQYKNLLKTTLQSAFLAQACSPYLTPSFKVWMDNGASYNRLKQSVFEYVKAVPKNTLFIPPEDDTNEQQTHRFNETSAQVAAMSFTTSSFSPQQKFCLYCSSHKHILDTCHAFREDIKKKQVRDDFIIPIGYICPYCCKQGQYRKHEEKDCPLLHNREGVAQSKRKFSEMTTFSHSPQREDFDDERVYRQRLEEWLSRPLC